MSIAVHRAFSLAFSLALSSADVVLSPHYAQAQPYDTLQARSATSALHVDAETDPTAFALSGYSLHLGLGHRAWRLDLGAFAMDIPQFVHGNSDFDTSFSGFGAKLQHFPFEDRAKLFIGLDASLNRVLVERHNVDLAVRQHQPSVGVNLGYRVMLPAEFYVTPWIGVGRVFNARDVSLGDKTFAMAAYSVFPAIHLGRRFQ